jgi:hypothetical protein
MNSTVVFSGIKLNKEQSWLAKIYLKI